MKKLTVFLFVFLTITFFCFNTYAKYVIEDTKIVANINIDGEAPKIEFISVSNTNEKYNNYANITHTITVEFRVKEKNIKKDNIQTGISFLVDDIMFYPSGKKVTRIEEGEYIYYKYELSKLRVNGRLKIKITKGSVVDIADQVNEEAVFDTGITIDNIAPVVNFSQEEIEDGKINAKIKANEKIREVNAWNLSEEDTVLSKEFACNVLYPFEVTDLAGNSTKIDVKIDKATNIKVNLLSLSETGVWERSEGLGEVIGKASIFQNSKYKTEAIAYRWEGVKYDFINVRCYINTYWGEGTRYNYNAYETTYYGGYNPKDETSKIPNFGLDGVGYLILGGLASNSTGKEIPKEYTDNYLQGISALTMKLKDDSYYSVVYQVWVEGNGWLEPASDGEETKLSYDKAIGALRFSLIPKTEKQYLVDSWKKDVGTNNMK